MKVNENNSAGVMLMLNCPGGIHLQKSKIIHLKNRALLQLVNNNKYIWQQKSQGDLSFY